MSADPQPVLLYEDPHLVAIDKPAGRLVIPGRGEAEGEALVTEISRYAGTKMFVVHRLDRETSGVVLFAKDAETHRALSRAFEGREVEKTYLAVVRGVVEQEGATASPLKERGSGRVSVHKDGKPAETRYTPVRNDGNNTLLEVHPLTGRRHQIRVHLYSIGHPIVGDPLYGEKRETEERMFLHAWRLRIPPGPWGEGRDFEAPIPEIIRF